jgi:uncharacterized membrane-anchored protein
MVMQSDAITMVLIVLWILAFGIGNAKFTEYYFNNKIYVEKGHPSFTKSLILLRTNSLNAENASFE